MIWLNPLAWLGLIVFVAPILIHILVQRRAERFAFPTLRFIQPTRLAAVRRHVLEDLPLLIVRAGVLAVAIGALAGPLLLTSARRQSWNARTVRAIVANRANAAAESPAFRSQTFEASDLQDGVRRAAAWLERAPPARRELVVAAPLALGSIAQADLAAVPPDIGIRLVRSGSLAAQVSFAGASVLSADPSRSTGPQVRARTIELNGASTSVRESPGAPSTVPVEIVAPPESRKAAEAALTAVLSQRVFAPLPGRTARVVFADSQRADLPAALVMPTEPWIADGIARIAGNEDLQAVNPDGTPSIVATSDGPVLVVRTTLQATEIATLRLLRAVLNALANPADTVSRPPPPGVAPAWVNRPPEIGDALQGVTNEILPIPDAQLRAWERPAAEVRTPRLDTIDNDDRRWWWAAALLLLALEAWMRRVRPAHADEADATSQEAARVA